MMAEADIVAPRPITVRMAMGTRSSVAILALVVRRSALLRAAALARVIEVTPAVIFPLSACEPRPQSCLLGLRRSGTCQNWHNRGPAAPCRPAVLFGRQSRR